MNFRPRAPLPLMAAGGLLLGLTATLWWSPGCPVRESTGLKCPGCGAIRSLEAWMSGDFGAGLYWNVLLVPGLALLTAAGFRPPWRGRGWLAVAGVTLGFGILRNLPFYLLY